MTPWNVIHALKQVSGSNDKLAILRKLEPDSEFWMGTSLALNPYVTFGIKKLPKKPDMSTMGPAVTFRDFKVLAEKLANRELTGHAARDAVLAFATACTEHQWEWWYRRLLDRNLDCGVGVDSINKVAPEGHQVQAFMVALAYDIKKVRPKHYPKSAWLEAKYDGVRTTWRITGTKAEASDVFEEASSLTGEAHAYSRNGKEFFNFGAIGKQLERAVEIEGFPASGIVIDGEVISENFNELMKHARRDADKAQFEGVLLAFDIIPADVFDVQGPTAPYEVRRAILYDILHRLQALLRAEGEEPLFELSEVDKGPDDQGYDLTQGTEPAEPFFNHCLSLKLEGIIIKRLGAPYVYERDESWLKLKPTETFDMKYVGETEGTGKYQGMMGAMLVEGRFRICDIAKENAKALGLDPKSEDEILVRSEVGTGITDKDRKEFWDHRSESPDRTVEIMADAISQNQRGGYSLRFPRYVRFRDDK